MFARLLKLPKRSFFLLGPRMTGKSTWLRQNVKDAVWFDLLRNDVYFELAAKPGLFREKVLAHPPSKWVVIDEVQRIPLLLNEVHSLIESHGYKFALTGSSARKLKREQANLLAGRALILNLFPLVFKEYGASFAVEDLLKFGTIPSILNDSKEAVRILEAYAGTYLREEIKEEALTRNVDSFSRFLEVASLANAQVTNLSNIAREASLARATVTNYFEILEDTLLARRLKAWTPRAKIKEVGHPKFYFFDCGVVRALQGRLREPLDSDEKGHLLETLVFNELNAMISYQNKGGSLSYWRTPSGSEIDFIWQRGSKTVAIEVKSSPRWKDEFDSGFKAILNSKAKPQKCFGVYLGSEDIKKSWGMVYSLDKFLLHLAQGKILD